MNTFTLRIIACDRIFYDGECETLVFPGADGKMGIMANHESMTTAVEIGEIKFRTPDGEEHVAITSDGILKVDNNQVDILVYSCERPEEIDEFRAKEAKERAMEQLAGKQSVMEYHISRASLARAMARLSGRDKYMGGR
ncbi:MAG: ATP synthase F1 subunit epsilon [Lachnospiraceae bacterium]|jgi:F-type H+-transporting ATPase subunit epsilon|nr:ATP synthase F1 subunit epsilon [Lachnospiraceae bacterium]